MHSFHSLLAGMATFTRNTMALASTPNDAFLLYPEPTAIQARSFELLGVPARLQAVKHHLQSTLPGGISYLHLASKVTSG